MNTPPTNPLHLLDDFLASLPSVKLSETPIEEAHSDRNDAQTFETSPRHDIHHDLVLRVAADLFESNMNLLENALGLLEEQEQRQREMQSADAQEGHTIIRTVRAKRSGMQTVLVQKQRKGKRNSNSGDDQTNDNDHYLVLLGRDRTDAYNQVHRRGMHCTCRSFLNNINGGGRKSNAAAEMISNQNIICKHLLAVILMPYLMPWRKDGVDVEVLDDKEFAKLIASCPI